MNKLPPDDLRVDFGSPAPGTSNPMPAEVRQAYEDRIRASADALNQPFPLACEHHFAPINKNRTTHTGPCECVHCGLVSHNVLPSLPHSGYGLCECGCGDRTNLASKTSRRNGWIQGEPMRFILNHHRRLSPVEYIEEDRGYKTPCWVWQRHIDASGYGKMQHNGAPALAHRVYYERVNGPIAEGLEPDHLCRVRACVNPDHLEPVVRAINVRRGKCAKLTQENVDAIRTSSASHADLARVYGVHPTTILRIRNFEKWRPVAA